MSDQMPPPGVERDLEIVDLLVATHVPDGVTRVYVGAYSTDPAACDRLVEEMVRRGFDVMMHASVIGTIGTVALPYHGQIECHWQSPPCPTRPAAISAAALLALRAEVTR